MSFNVENKAENTTNQEKPDTNLIQPKVESNPIQTEAKKDEAQEDPNWRAFREARKKDRAEREAAERRAAEKEAEAAALKAAMEAAFSSKSNPITPQNYYADQQPQEETEDQRIEKKVQAAIAAREAQAEKARIQREQQEYPQRLIRDFPDFNNIITDENLAYMDYHHPEISRPLNRLPDSFDKWSDIYHVIKKFVPNNTTAKKEALKAEINQNKPRSISSTGLTQAGETQGSARLTEDKKAANWERMQKTIKGVS